MSRMPDFIVIGAMKCATSTLHVQLASQPGVFMSTPKEPNFFSDDEVFARGLDWYGELFEEGGESDLCGESSTHYTKRPTHPRTVARMIDALPDHVRFIYVMRDPIDRLISQYIHEWSQGVITESIDEAVHLHTELVEYSRYAYQLQPYFEGFGEARILPVYFERLNASPQRELGRIATFLGHEGELYWRDDVEPQNVSSSRIRRSGLLQTVLDIPGMKTLRRALIPQSMRDRMNARFAMRERPVLSDDTVARLVDTFDADLQHLQDWTGLPLKCRNWSSIVRASGESSVGANQHELTSSQQEQTA